MPLTQYARDAQHCCSTTEHVEHAPAMPFPMSVGSGRTSVHTRSCLEASRLLAHWMACLCHNNRNCACRSPSTCRSPPRQPCTGPSTTGSCPHNTAGPLGPSRQASSPHRQHACSAGHPGPAQHCRWHGCNLEKNSRLLLFASRFRTQWFWNDVHGAVAVRALDFRLKLSLL